MKNFKERIQKWLPKCSEGVCWYEGISQIPYAKVSKSDLLPFGISGNEENIYFGYLDGLGIPWKLKGDEYHSMLFDQFNQLPSDFMEQIISVKEWRKCRSFVAKKSEGDSLKADLAALDTYILYREKQEQKGKRENFQQDLKKLISKFNIPEMEQVLPDEKQRLSVRGVLHRQLKKEIKSR